MDLPVRASMACKRVLEREQQAAILAVRLCQ
jgi:hypothetical protein